MLVVEPEAIEDFEVWSGDADPCPLAILAALLLSLLLANCHISSINQTLLNSSLFVWKMEINQVFFDPWVRLIERLIHQHLCVHLTAIHTNTAQTFVYEYSII